MDLTTFFIPYSSTLIGFIIDCRLIQGRLFGVLVLWRYNITYLVGCSLETPYDRPTIIASVWPSGALLA